MDELRELHHLANRIYDRVRAGRPIAVPSTAVHRALVDEMGGTAAWEAMKADLAIAEREIQ